MYSYLIGRITEKTGVGVTLEVNGIGYYIFCANPYKYPVDEEVKMYVYQQIREDEQSLFGFDNREDLNLFLQLIAVKGLGCRMVLPMFYNNEREAIMKAIEQGDINFLISFPKIGNKLAQQIILDLKGKLVDQKPKNQELIDTLKALGYRRSEIEKVIKNIDNSQTIETQIKEALKLL